ncbi:MAG TPA: hypothetical protein VMM92_08200 [Thermoanaerobaculia bacterium]|nr:hypothetical protein [Thermoanaerobaculia bacterium]
MAPAPAGNAEPAKDGKVVVVDPGVDSSHSSETLAEAARAERERRAQSGAPVMVITNKTLAHSKGQLTYATPAPAPAKAKAGESAKEASPQVGSNPQDKTAQHDEAYWRKRGLDIRQRWRLAADEIHKLEQDVADWRRRFYSEDDPAIRDSRIKPEWDRALDRLQHKKEDVEAAQRDLELYMEEGRRSGALPGWLREGADLEPAPPSPPPAPTDAIEPPQLKEGPP